MSFISIKLDIRCIHLTFYNINIIIIFTKQYLVSMMVSCTVTFLVTLLLNIARVKPQGKDSVDLFIASTEYIVFINDIAT